MLGFGGSKELVVEEPGAAPWGTAVGIDERYAPLVDRLSEIARQDSDGYRRRVVLAAAMGYAVIGAVILVCAGTVFGLLFLMFAAGETNLLFGKILVVAAVIGWAVLRSLWVSAEPPEGRRVTRSEAPDLFLLVEGLRSKIGGPRIHQILISRDFNASIVQVPRLGFLGWYRNYLVVGLPLLQGMSPDEAAAVIAHELGHFAGQHGRLASTVYRVRMTWAQLSEQLQEGHSANLLRRFFRWYGPWFNAYSFVLARSHEYEADRSAADATSPATMAAALVRLTVQADRFDAGWARCWDQAVEGNAPEPSPFAECRSWFSEPDEGLEDRSLARALSQSTGLEDTHPCLADRLAALGVRPQIPAPSPRSAADALLGAAADAIGAEFDESWRSESADAIGEARLQREEEACELGRLRELAADSPLTAEQRRREADLVACVEGRAASIPYYDALAAEDPEDLVSVWYAGFYRLLGGEIEAAAGLEALAARAPDFAVPVHEALLAFHEGRGDLEAASRARRSLAEAVTRESEGAAEFRTLRPEDPLEAPLLGEEDREEFRRSVDGIPGLASVHVGWRMLAASGARQQVLMVKLGLRGDPNDVLSSVGERLLPYGDYLGFTYAADTKWLYARLKAIDGTQLYP